MLPITRWRNLRRLARLWTSKMKFWVRSWPTERQNLARKRMKLGRKRTKKRRTMASRLLRSRPLVICRSENSREKRTNLRTPLNWERVTSVRRVSRSFKRNTKGISRRTSPTFRQSRTGRTGSLEKGMLSSPELISSSTHPGNLKPKQKANSRNWIRKEMSPSRKNLPMKRLWMRQPSSSMNIPKSSQTMKRERKSSRTRKRKESRRPRTRVKYKARRGIPWSEGRTRMSRRGSWRSLTKRRGRTGKSGRSKGCSENVKKPPFSITSNFNLSPE